MHSQYAGRLGFEVKTKSPTCMNSRPSNTEKTTLAAGAGLGAKARVQAPSSRRRWRKRGWRRGRFWVVVGCLGEARVFMADAASGRWLEPVPGSDGDKA